MRSIVSAEHDGCQWLGNPEEGRDNLPYIPIMNLLAGYASVLHRPPCNHCPSMQAFGNPLARDVPRRDVEAPALKLTE